MTRQKLPNRRFSVTRPVVVQMDGGAEVRILITVGFCGGRPREVFCADFKAGTSLHAIVMDACILFSRLLQHGDEPGELLGSMCQPHSLLGTIASAVKEFELAEEDQAPCEG